MPKKKKILLIVLSVLIIFAITAFFLLPKIFNKKVAKESLVANETSESTQFVSPFEQYVEKEKVPTEEVLPVGPNELNNLMKRSMDFLNNNKVNGGGNIYLQDGEAVVEVVIQEDRKVYKLLASKNPSINNQIGENINFIPEVEQDDLFVQYDGGIAYAKEVEGYALPGSLNNGDKIVFVCKNAECSDGILLWALVYREF